MNSHTLAHSDPARSPLWQRVTQQSTMNAGPAPWAHSETLQVLPPTDPLPGKENSFLERASTWEGAHVTEKKNLETLIQSWGNKNGATIMENRMEFPQNILKKNYHIIQQSHLWACGHRNSKQDLQEVFAYPHSLQYLFTMAKRRRKPKCPTDTLVKKMRYIHSTEYYAAFKKEKSCHLQRCRWILNIY